MRTAWWPPAAVVVMVMGFSAIEIFLNPMFPAVGMAGGLGYLLGIAREKTRQPTPEWSDGVRRHR